jgi:hypothetical protein
MCESEQRQAGVQIEITPAMIEAGVAELRDCYLGTSLDEIAREVWLAMETERFAGLQPRQSS